MSAPGRRAPGLAIAAIWLLASCAAKQPEAPPGPTIEELHESASLAAQERRHQDAIHDYRALLMRTPEDAESYFNLGNQYRYVGDFGAAIAAYKAAIRADPELVRAYNNLGNALSAVGDHRSAVIVLKRAVALEPSYPRGHNSLGIAYDGMGEHSKAVLTFKEALRLDPTYADAHSNLGNALANLRLWDDAIASYQTAIRLEPNNPVHHYNLGWIYVQAGKPGEARNEYAILETLDSAKAEELGRAITAGASPDAAEDGPPASP
jgi:tetratricopeptide (TPR) repeat protein